jgi:hypothetical protein
MSALVFWVVKHCELVGRYQSFGGTSEDGGRMFPLHITAVYVPDKLWNLPTRFSS